MKKLKPRELEKIPEVKRWVDGLGDSTRHGYTSVLGKFCEFAQMNPTEIIAQREKDLQSTDKAVRRRLDEKVLAFCLSESGRRKKRGEGDTGKGSASTWLATMKSFFAANHAGLDLSRQDTRKITKHKRPVYEDYMPTREDLKAMCRAASLRDRAILLTLASTGISGDVCDLERRHFEARWGKDNQPFSIAPRDGWLYREKTEVKMRPFLTHDATEAVADYLRSRKDGAPWLFVAGGSKQLKTPEVDRIVKRCARRAGVVIPEGQRLRMHVFRSFFRTNCAAKGINTPHIDVMCGHTPTGTGPKFYERATEEQLRDEFNKVEPYLSISHISNMALERNQYEVALDDQMKVTINLIRQAVGDEKLKDAAEFILATRPKMVKWDPETEHEPAVNRQQRILGGVLAEMTPVKKFRQQTAPRKRRGEPTVDSLVAVPKKFGKPTAPRKRKRGA